jgi:phosphoesterase RecJ-like protein
MEITAKLMRAGINFSKIQQEAMFNRNKVQIAIYTTAMNNLRYTESGIAYTTLTKQELQDSCAEYIDLNNIVENILNIDGIKASVFLTERESGYAKASFRSHDVDVNAVARAFGGGGHKFAAAAGFEAPFEDAVAQILAALEEAIAKHNE